MAEEENRRVSRSPLSQRLTREQVEEGLRTAQTKRQFDVLVDAFRRPGAFPIAERDELELLARQLVQRFGSGAALAQGAQVVAGRYRFGFRNAVRER